MAMMYKIDNIYKVFNEYSTGNGELHAKKIEGYP